MFHKIYEMYKTAKLKMDMYYDNLVNELGEREKLRERVLGKEAKNTSPNKENDLLVIITPNEKKQSLENKLHTMRQKRTLMNLQMSPMIYT